MATSKNKESGAQGEARLANAPQVRFDTANLKSSYANVCTMNCTREEVVINFGINQSWERTPTEMVIELSNRVILSPFAAMRMLDMLQKLMEEYRGRYGEATTRPPVPAAD
jgi:hypothetical protein